MAAKYALHGGCVPGWYVCVHLTELSGLLANVDYLAVLYYTIIILDGDCTQVTRSQDHSQCSPHVVQGDVLLNIDDNIDTVLGLAAFYK